MEILEIRVKADRRFNHPYEQYSNFGPGVEYFATLTDGDDVVECTRALQRQAETAAEEAKQKILADLKAADDRKRAEFELARAMRDSKNNADVIARIKDHYPDIVVPALAIGPSEDIDERPF